MTQQINLYQSVFHPKKNPLSARKLVTGVAAFGLTLVVIYALARFHFSGLGEQLEVARDEQASLLSRLETLQAEVAAKKKSELLENEIARLTAERNARRPLAALVEADEGANTEGFSPYLEVLARRSVPGVWLRRIAISGRAGNKVVLEGRALGPELVPRYLQALAREGQFSGIEFDKLSVLRAAADSDFVDFRMETDFFEGSHEPN